MNVIKRNGSVEQFNVKKIASALHKVYEEIGEPYTFMDCIDQANFLTSYYIEENIDEIDIETIQDDVEMYLMGEKRFKAAKAYIRYRDKQTEERNNPWSENDERQDLILSKYTKEDENKKDFIKRISIGNTKLEKIFRNREGIWGGRNLYAIGREGNITGSNCYVATAPKDSMEDIYRAAYEIARTYSYGGGQGMNLSNLRPKGAKVNNSSNTTPGVMTFAELYSFITLNTQQENRRGALMLDLDIDHPDIIDFITAKLDISKINGANISVAVSDDFMKAVENDENWKMRFETSHEVIEKEVKAKELMRLIAYANHTVGDPGFLMMDTMNNYHLLSEYPEVHFNATNPCGEQPLMENGSCNLGSVNLNAFVKNPFTPEAYFDFDRFKEVVMEMTWGLDELLTMLGERHALPEQRDHVYEWREIGLGVMGLADLALSIGLGYGTEGFIKVLDEIMSVMANSSAQASAIRAKELGVFPKYNYDYISSSEFFNNVYNEKTKSMIKEYGLRNSRILSIAPTGSISNVLGVSGGVEPFFMLGYQRTIKSMFEKERTIWVYEKTPQKMIEALGLKNHTDLPDWAQITSQNIKFEDRARVQSTIQKYVDTAISSTFNLANEATVEDIENIYMTAWKYNLKGATVFRDNCKKIGILTGGGEHFDKNPADKPSITIHEKWYNKHTGETKEYVNFVQISDNEYTSEKIEHEKCPICGEHLVKQGGCTKCSDPECVYEKCSI